MIFICSKTLSYFFKNLTTFADIVNIDFLNQEIDLKISYKDVDLLDNIDSDNLDIDLEKFNRLNYQFKAKKLIIENYWHHGNSFCYNANQNISIMCNLNKQNQVIKMSLKYDVLQEISDKIIPIININTNQITFVESGSIINSKDFCLLIIKLFENNNIVYYENAITIPENTTLGSYEEEIEKFNEQTLKFQKEEQDIEEAKLKQQQELKEKSDKQQFREKLKKILIPFGVTVLIISFIIAGKYLYKKHQNYLDKQE